MNLKLLKAISILILGARLATGATVQYNLTLTDGKAAPDGVERDVYLINGQTPGPPIVATEGDDVEIIVINHISVPATIHFHGVEMKGTPWSDGVPGVTMKMMDPGMVFIHRFKATPHGLYWYHAHSRAIYGDGVRGHFIIHPNTEHLSLGPWSLISNNSVDIAALQAAHILPKIVAGYDWTHWTSDYEVSEWNRTKTELLCIDSVLINGKGRVGCPTNQTLIPYQNEVRPNLTVKGCALPTNKNIQPFNDSMPSELDPKIFFECTNTTTPFEVIEVNRAEKWASIGLMNIGALWDIKYAIDDHPLYIYAADGQYHTPQKVDAVLVPPGERYTAMIKLDRPIGEYTIRAAVKVTPQVISGYAVLSYKRTVDTGKNLPAPKNPAIGYGADLLPKKTELNPITLTPFPESIKPPPVANATILLNLERLNSLAWAMNRDPFGIFLEDQDPLLFSPSRVNDLAPDLVPHYPVGSVVDAVIISNKGNPSHPIHKHGVKAFVLAQAEGEFTWATVAEAQLAQPGLFNLVNPPYRDGFHTLDAVQDPAFIVIRYVVTEPSVTFFHCHINIHTYGGMAVALMEGPEAIPGIKIPQYYIDWNERAKASQVDQKQNGCLEGPLRFWQGSTALVIPLVAVALNEWQIFPLFL